MKTKPVVFTALALLGMALLFVGIARTGTGPLGDRGPNLCGENGDAFDYGIGRLLAEDYRSSGISAVSA
ncbi:hypothetical protein [Burkholderia anthina]|uniref:hypothetical protein n=1 Tax=Burkholderia anthina TaxID=179879 RepID=UPI00158E9729|nr:hypothetical protein [Burkholderia anthina]